MTSKIAIIGNGGGGKSTMAHTMSQAMGLPWHEVDRMQFQPNWQRTPEEDVRQSLLKIMETPRWIIDGFGPWDTIEMRFERANVIYFIDFPIWVHFWWAAERQIQAALGQQRLGGPEQCDLTQINELMFKTLWHVHENVRPKLLEVLQTRHQNKLVHITDIDAYQDRLFQIQNISETHA